MSTAQKKYARRMEILMATNDIELAKRDSVYIDYIIELQFAKAELIEFVKDFYYDPVLCELLNVETVLKMQTLLQKHGVS